jgi:GNAT superfamily N-acetyltransferase
VGTASAWYDRRYRDGTYGMVHWIAMRPSSQGKGLGKALLAFTMRTLAQWHDKCILGTQSKRIGAINLYLKFGFVPDVSDSDSAKAWRELSKSIKHPLLEKALAGAE